MLKKNEKKTRFFHKMDKLNIDCVSLLKIIKLKANDLPLETKELVLSIIISSVKEVLIQDVSKTLSESLVVEKEMPPLISPTHEPERSEKKTFSSLLKNGIEFLPPGLNISVPKREHKPEEKKQPEPVQTKQKSEKKTFLSVVKKSIDEPKEEHIEVDSEPEIDINKPFDKENDDMFSISYRKYYNKNFDGKDDHLLLTDKEIIFDENFPSIKFIDEKMSSLIKEGKNSYIECSFIQRKNNRAQDIMNYLFKNFPKSEYHTEFFYDEDENKNTLVNITIIYMGIDNSEGIYEIVSEKFRTETTFMFYTTCNRKAVVASLHEAFKEQYNIEILKGFSGRCLPIRFSLKINSIHDFPSNHVIEELIKCSEKYDERLKKNVVIFYNVPFEAVKNVKKINGFSLIKSKNFSEDKLCNCILY